jgi:hypothetical protein
MPIELRLLELQLISEQKIGIYSSASIAANPMLAVRCLSNAILAKF